MRLAIISTHSTRLLSSLNYYRVLSQDLPLRVKPVIYRVAGCQVEGVDPASSSAGLHNEQISSALGTSGFRNLSPLTAGCGWPALDE